MLRSTRNQIECAFGRLKARWRIFLRAIDVDISLIPSRVFTFFILYNFCKMRKIPVREDSVQGVVNKERIDQHCEHHAIEHETYTYTTGTGEIIRDTIKVYFSLQ